MVKNCSINNHRRQKSVSHTRQGKDRNTFFTLVNVVLKLVFEHSRQYANANPLGLGFTYSRDDPERMENNATILLLNCRNMK